MLEGLRIVELTTEAGGALAGRLLAGYGADVVVVEPPGGHPVRHISGRAGDGADGSILFAHLGAGKRSIAGELGDPDFKETVRALVSGADALIESFAPGELAALGLGPALLLEANPRLVVCSITPFGQSGPRAHWRMTSLTAAAAGGQMAMCGDADKPPLKTAGHQAAMQAGLHAFSAILAAVYAARRDGVGDWLDLSVQEVQVSTLEGAGPAALMMGTEAGRAAGNRPFAQWGIHECKNGYIGVAAMPRQSFSVYDCIEHPELKDDPAFASGWSPEANEVLSLLIPEWTSQYEAAEIFEIAARYRAPFSMIPGPRELLEWPGLQDVEFWREVNHPVLGRHPWASGPIIVGDGDRGTPRRAPLLDEHGTEILRDLGTRAAGAPAAAESGAALLPFAGIRVVDMTQVWAGPYGTRFLSDQGAEVIKVEGPSFADPIRTMTGARSAPEINQSSYFNEYNRNKLGVSLDIKQPEGMEALKRLIAVSDVFVENWSSGVAERLGLGFEELQKINPRIISVSMPGFGHKGRDAQRVGFGPTIEQMGGLVALQGYEGGEPHRSGISYGDPVAGTIAAGAVAMALVNRERTGEGIYAVVPQRDGICGLIAEYVIGEAIGQPLPTRIGNRDMDYAPHNVYRAAETAPRPVRMRAGQPPLMELTDGWLAVAVDSDDAWRGLKGVVGSPDLESPDLETVAGRQAGRERIDAAIAAWAAGRDPAEAASQLQAAGVPASPVLSPLLVTSDAHLEERGAFLPYDHPDAGSGRTTRPAWRLERRPALAVRPAPRFGEHSRDVLQRVAGYTAGEVDALASRQVTTADLIAGAAG